MTTIDRWLLRLALCGVILWCWQHRKPEPIVQLTTTPVTVKHVQEVQLPSEFGVPRRAK